MRLFDAYLFVDWSALSKPSSVKPTADAIWAAELAGSTSVPVERYHRTRHEATEWVLQRLQHHVAAARRVLVGFDFSYGYPAGFADALGLQSDGQAWRRIWEHLSDQIADAPDNANNRFEVASSLNSRIGQDRAGPFWGCPKALAGPVLETTSPGFPFETRSGAQLTRLRQCELRASGVQETWKLMYSGCVGSQTLMGIPRLLQLLEHPSLSRCSEVWPFSTGFAWRPSVLSGPTVLHAEIWPGLVDQQVRKILAEQPTTIKDQAQVRAKCEWARDLDVRGDLIQLFDPPAGLTDQQLTDCIGEEGWILGVP